MEKKIFKKIPKSVEVGSVSVDAKQFSHFLNGAFLNGRLNECVLKSKEGSLSVNAMDPSNIVFISIREDIDLSKFGDLGLGDIQIISKFLSLCPEEQSNQLKLVKKENRLILSHSGIKVEYLLTDPNLITTTVEDGKISELVESCDFSFRLSKATKEAFISSVNLLKVKTSSLVVRGNEVFLTGGLTHEHTFELDPILLETGPSDQEFVCSFYADYVKDVFSVLEFKDEEEPIIIFNPEFPMIVQEGNNSWAVFPLTLD